MSNNGSFCFTTLYRLVSGALEGWTLGGGVAVGVVVAVLLVSWWAGRWSSSLLAMKDPSCPFPLPPGSMGWPLVGETLEFVRKGGEFYASRLARHGTVYKTHVIGCPVVRVVGGEHVKHVLMGEHVSVRTHCPQSVQRLVGPRSLLGMSCEEHRKVKPLIGAIFTPTVMASFLPRIQAVVDRHLDKWCRLSAAEGHILGFLACQQLSLDLALEVILGQNVERSLDDSLPCAMREFVENVFCLPVNIPGFGFWKGLRARERILEEVRDKLDMRPERSEEDFRSIVELMRMHPDVGQQRQLIEDTALELFFAGYSTTSSAFCNILMCMGRNPEAMQKLKVELEEEGLLQDPAMELTFDVVERLHYTHSCGTEVLRFFPPVGAVFRKAIKTLQIGGYQVPKEWLVACSIRETQQTSQLFPDPDLFRPERWLEMDEEVKEKSRYEYLPFGSGVRVCVGRRLAILFQAVFLVEVIRRCRYFLKNPHPPMVYFPVAKAKDDLPVVFQPRPGESRD